MADGAVGGFNTAALNYPIDVKINWNGNIVYTDSHNDLVRAICYDNADADFCTPVTGLPAVITIAGQAPTVVAGVLTPNPGDAGQGAPANQAQVAYPAALLLGKQTGDDVNPFASGTTQTQSQYEANFDGNAATNKNGLPFFANFRDNNIIFTEKLLAKPAELAGVTTPTPLYKIAMAPMTGVTAMYMGVSHTCTMTGDATPGAVYCIGTNANGELGNANATNPDPNPTNTAALTSDIDIGEAATLGGGDNFTCAIGKNHAVAECWAATIRDSSGKTTPQAPNLARRRSPGDPQRAGSIWSKTSPEAACLRVCSANPPPRRTSGTSGASAKTPRDSWVPRTASIPSQATRAQTRALTIRPRRSATTIPTNLRTTAPTGPTAAAATTAGNIARQTRRRVTRQRDARRRR